MGCSVTLSSPLWGSQENLRQFRKSFSGSVVSRRSSHAVSIFRKFDPKSEYLGRSLRSHFWCVGWNLAMPGIWMPTEILVIFPYLNRTHHLDTRLQILNALTVRKGKWVLGWANLEMILNSMLRTILTTLFFWSQILILRYKTLKQILGGFYMRQTSSNFYLRLIFPAQTLKECEM